MINGSDVRSRLIPEAELRDLVMITAKNILSRLLILLVLFWRTTVGRLLVGHCRFVPTCSQYMIEAIQKYGPLRGTWIGLKRISRCRPFGPTGYDPV